MLFAYLINAYSIYWFIFMMNYLAFILLKDAIMIMIPQTLDFCS